jgi:hypothetical protein
VVAGISSLLSGNYSEAEEYLQLAARWANNPLDNLTSMSNLGFFAEYM